MREDQERRNKEAMLKEQVPALTSKYIVQIGPAVSYDHRDHSFTHRENLGEIKYWHDFTRL